MKIANITLSFPVRIDTDGNGFSYVDDSRLPISCYGTNGTATKQLREQLQKHVDVSLDNFYQRGKRVIVANDGTVLICEYNGQFYYSIASSSRGYGGSVHANWKSFQEVSDAARKHAENCYGGIAWESSF